MFNCKLLTEEDRPYLSSFLDILNFRLDEFVDIFGKQTIDNVKDNHTIENILKRSQQPNTNIRYVGCYKNNSPAGILIEESLPDVKTNDLYYLNLTQIYWFMVKDSNNGVGSNLLEYVITKSKERKDNFLSLRANADSPAVKLYSRFGFKIVEKKENRYLMFHSH